MALILGRFYKLHDTKMKFSIKDFFSNCDQETADLVTFTEEILNRKLHFCVVKFVKFLCNSSGYDNILLCKTFKLPKIGKGGNLEIKFFIILFNFKNPRAYNQNLHCWKYLNQKIN